MLLIYPVHQRYIKLLRKQVEKGCPILLTQSDIDGFKDLLRRTKQKEIRHKGLYRLTLKAIYRPKEEIQKVGIRCVLGTEEINLIEKTLAKAERRSLYASIIGSIIWYCRKHKLMSGANTK